MNVVIIEDEPLSAKHVTNLLTKIDKNLEVVAVLDSVATAVTYLQQHTKYDVIIADINLSDGLSFDVFSKVAITAPVIFTTAYDEHAVRAFRLNSVSFLLKPVGIEDLAEALSKARIAKLENPAGINLEDVRKVIRREFKRRFLVKQNNEPRAIKEEEISFFLPNGKGAELWLENGSYFPVDFSLDQLEMMLDPRVFFRINKNVLVHLDSIIGFKPDINGQLLVQCTHLDLNDSIVSRENAFDFKDWYRR